MTPDPSSYATDLRRVGIDPHFWYPIARSTDVKAGALRAVSFAGDPIMLGRTESGRIFGLEDRCAHRQVPLHLGAICGEKLQCGYHGWRYDTSGKVSGIPYLPKGAPRPPRGVRAYPSREAYGLIFVFPGEAERAEHTPFPEIPQFGVPERLTLWYSRQIQCHYTFMHENLIDMSHQFLHRRVMGFVQPVLQDYQRGDTWVEARYMFDRVAGGKYLIGADFMIAGGKRKKAVDNDNKNGDADRELMTIRTQYPYQLLSVWLPGDDDSVFDLWAAYVPLDREQRTNQSFGILCIKKPGIPGLMQVLKPFIRYFIGRVFREDQMIVEAEQRAWDRQGRDRNHEVFPLLLEVRDVLARNGVPLSAASQSAGETTARAN
jgi:renierapurpurin 18,18'-hydroxylase